MKPIENPDITNEDPDYWSDVLTSWDLSLEKGSPPRFWVNRDTETPILYRRLNFVGTSENLQGVQEQQFRRKLGKTSPSGTGSDE